MAGTLQLDALLERAVEAGASVRLLGDPSQLAAVDVGGALDLLEHEVGATYLSELHGFKDPEEARATMAIRVGDAHALASTDRPISAGSRDAMLESAYDAWARRPELRVDRSRFLRRRRAERPGSHGASSSGPRES